MAAAVPTGNPAQAIPAAGAAAARAVPAATAPRAIRARGYAAFLPRLPRQIVSAFFGCGLKEDTPSKQAIFLAGKQKFYSVARPWLTAAKEGDG